MRARFLHISCNGDFPLRGLFVDSHRDIWIAENLRKLFAQELLKLAESAVDDLDGADQGNIDITTGTHGVIVGQVWMVEDKQLKCVTGLDDVVGADGVRGLNACARNDHQQRHTDSDRNCEEICNRYMVHGPHPAFDRD